MKKALLFYPLIVPFLLQTVCVSEPQQSPPSLDAQVDALLAEKIPSGGPGGAVAVIRDGTVVYAQARGLADMESKAPNTTQTVFNIASCSKQFTAACVALLAEDGKLKWDDDIRTYLPEIPAYDKPITVRQLIHHTGGVRSFDVLFLLAGSGADALRNEPALLDLLCRQPRLNFTPGERHMYSNSGYFLLSKIVQRVSGQTLGEFARARLFEPLGMSSTVIYERPGQEIPNRAYGYTPGKAEGSYLRCAVDPITGNSNVFSSVEDLAKWDRNFYGSRIGGKDFIPTLLTEGRLNNGEKTGYAFGLFCGTHKGLPIYHHQGGDRGIRAYTVRFPEQRFSVVCLANTETLDPEGLSKQIADLYLTGTYPPEKSASPAKAEPKPERKEITLEPSVCGQFIGKYVIDDESTFYVTRESDRLFLSGTYQPKTELHAASESEFFLREVDATVRFSKSESGCYDKMAFHIGEFDINGSRVPYHEPAEDELRDYTGEYYSGEILSTYHVECSGGKLYLRTPIHQEEIPHLRLSDPLTHDLADRFGSPISPIAFTRDAEGHVCGLDILNLGRIQHVKFVRKQ